MQRFVNTDANGINLELDRYAVKCIEDAPTADVVEVVRCRDCKFYQDNNGGYPHENCKWNIDETPDEDDYCSGGERREDEQGEVQDRQEDRIN